MFPPDTPVRVTDGVWVDHTGTVHQSNPTTTLVKLTLTGGGHVIVGFDNIRLETVA